MTRLEDVFMLSYDSLLDFETVSEIMKQGNVNITATNKIKLSYFFLYA